MNSWQKFKIKDICNVASGSTPRTAEASYWNGTIPWITPMDLSKQKSKYISQGERNITEKGLKNSSAELLPAHSLIMSSRAPIGYFAINTNQATTNQGCKTFICSTLIEVEFLYYYLQNYIDEIKRLGSGSTFAEVGKKHLENLVVQIPQILVQKKIAKTLSLVDEAIEKTDQIIQKTEKLKKGLMQELFTKGIDHKKFKKTKIGEIPEEWEVFKLSKYIKELNAGVSVNSEDRPKLSDEIGILKTSAVSFGFFNPKEHKTVLDRERIRVSIPVKANRIIISRMNTKDLVGANAYTNFNYSDLFLPDRLWQMEPRDEEIISMRWLSYIVYSLWINGEFASLASGTSASMKNISKSDVLNIEIAFPPKREQEKIAEILSTVDEKIDINKKIKEKLLRLKKGLMQDIFSQKVEVN